MRKIYEVMDIADSAYIMHSGKLTFFVSEDDRYSVEGKEIIFGAEEPLIARKMNREEYFRFQSAFADDDSIIEKIPLANLYRVISIYNIGYGITKNIAKYVEITNKMYVSKEKKLSGQDMAAKEYAGIYVDVIDNLKNIQEQLKVSWLGQIIDRYSNSLVYTKGRAFRKSTGRSDLKFQFEKLDEYTFTVKAGSILFEEGDKGHEMFIVNSGNLEVYIGGKKVADIHEPGSVIGEMALLLGERRTATVKTVTDCNITIVKPENLKAFAENTKDFFLNMAANLGRRLEHNCSMIRETHDILLESQSSDKPLPPKERTNYRELLCLLKELEQYEIKYKNQWMSDLIQKVKVEIKKTRDRYAEAPE